MAKIPFVKVTRVNLQDRDLPNKTYALAQSRDTLSLEELGHHMRNHGCNYDEGDINAILTKTTKCVKELLQDGYRICLGDLGIFSVALMSKGVCESLVDEETHEKPVFTADDIVGIRVKWTSGSALTSASMMQGVGFEETITHKAKAELLKQQKEERANG